MRKRVRTIAQGEAIKAQIVALVEAGPKSSAEIAAALNIGGCSLGNYFTTLLRSGAISRHQYRKGQYRYYIGNTAPDVPYKPAPSSKKPEPEKRQHRIPVKRVIVRPFSIAGENGMSATITLPAAPWEAAA